MLLIGYIVYSMCCATQHLGSCAVSHISKITVNHVAYDRLLCMYLTVEQCMFAQVWYPLSWCIFGCIWALAVIFLKDKFFVS